MSKVVRKKNDTVAKTAVTTQDMLKIREEYAIEILEKLAEEDAGISKRINELALELYKDVDVDSIADDVFSDLNILDVEDVWENSGSASDVYVAPYDLASEMFEEALEPYIDEMKDYQARAMDDEAKLTCMGILKGIYKFEKEATTEFKEYSPDDPYRNFDEVFDEWKSGNKNPKNSEAMNVFIKENFPEWHKGVLGVITTR